MKIQTSNRNPSISQAKKTSGKSGGFSTEKTNSTGGTAATSPTQSVPVVAALMNDLLENRRRNKHHLLRADILLEELENLRVGLISQSIPGDVLKHLEKTLSKTSADDITDDDQLKDIILDIETRVAVELAKLERELS